MRTRRDDPGIGNFSVDRVKQVSKSNECLASECSSEFPYRFKTVDRVKRDTTTSVDENTHLCREVQYDALSQRAWPSLEF